MPRPEFEPILVGAIARSFAWSSVVVLTAVIVGYLTGFVMPLVSVASFFETLRYRLQVRRLTRKLTRLPRKLSVRLYAFKQNPSLLVHEAFMMVGGVSMAIALFLFIPMNPVDTVLTLLGLATFVWFGCIAGYVLNVRRKVLSDGVA